MQTRREYLVGLGLARPGRGKFSHTAKVALIEAAEKGITFSDGEIVPRTTPTVKPTAPVVNDAANSQYLTPDDYRFPEAEYRGVVFEDGKRKEVTLRWACNTCKVSLVNHGCDNPTILDNIAVKIERR